MYVVWKDNMVQEMDYTREVIANIDCNAPWLPHRYHADVWYAAVAARASQGLRYMNTARNRYGIHRGMNRTYYKATVTPDTVEKVLLWLERSFMIRLYSSVDEEELHVRVENTPVCPACGRHTQLMWKSWEAGIKYSLSKRFNLIWGCPNPKYSAECSSTIRRVWPHMAPEVVYDFRVLPTFFHDWNEDGHPIPDRYLEEPLSEWSLSSVKAGEEKATITLTEEVNMTKSRRARRPEFTPEMITFIKGNYREGGPDAFARKFPKFRCSRYDIQWTAYKLGVTNKKLGRPKLTR